MVRLQCYEGQDETKALYDWDYGKQLLYTQLLRDKIGEIVAEAPDLESAVDLLAKHDSVFFSERFLAPRPLFESIHGDEPAVLLIDEIDRADEALEAVLLETLGEYQISIPEIGRFAARTAPLVLLTSNNTRDLSAALKRRCLHLFLDYPDADRELEILRSKETGLSDALAAQLVQVVRGLRDLELRKAPSISETIDWARTLAVLGATELDAATLADTVSVVVKYERDHARAVKALPKLVDPNAVVPDHRPDHAHGHGHSHSHGDHTHSHGDGDHDHDHDDHRAADHDHGPDQVGVTRRAEKDRPGRHGPGHYGTPPYAAGDDDLVPEPLPTNTVGPDRGKRSFAAGLGRRRAI